MLACETADVDSGKKREEPGFPTAEKAEEAMEELLALVDRNKSDIEAAVSEVDQPGLSGEKLEELQVKTLLPKLADIVEPLIKKYKIWRIKGQFALAVWRTLLSVCTAS